MAAPRSEWEAPPDPDFEKLAREGYAMWEADRPKVVAFDTETTGVEFVDTPFCVTVAWEHQGKLTGHYFELVHFDSREAVRRILATPILVGHSTKFDLQKCVSGGMLDRDTLDGHMIEDTQVMAHLLDENRERGLKELAVSLLGYDDTIEVEVASGPNKGAKRLVSREKHEVQVARRKLKLKKADGYEKLPRGIIVPYAISDALHTLGLYRYLKPQLARHEDMTAKYREEMELCLVLLDMEIAGLGVNDEYVREQLREYTKRVIKHDNEVARIVGRPVGKDPETEFNPASNPQLKEFFTAAGFQRDSYNRTALEKIDHPLARLLVQRRKDSKMLETYFRAIEREERDLILHPSFKQNVSTGRMSSGKYEDD